ncbi:MAG: SCO family protein [Burkholderiaceae bacterium]
MAVRTLLACAATAALGAGALAAATDGFSAFTYDTARVQRALRAPYPLPVDLALVTHEGRHMRLADFDAPVLLVNFVFTRCAGICRSAGDVYGRLGHALAADIERGGLRLLTVSIDPTRDPPQELARWRARYAPSGAQGWIVGAPPDRSELARWQDAFGIVVLPLPNGDFEHNAAIAVVGPQRRIRAFVTPERADELPQWVRRAAQAVDDARGA